MSERVNDIKELVRLFKPERYSFLVLAVLAAAFLFGCAIWLLNDDPKAHMAQVIGMMGSGGVVTFAIGSVYRFWSDAKEMYLKPNETQHDKG